MLTQSRQRSWAFIGIMVAIIFTTIAAVAYSLISMGIDTFSQLVASLREIWHQPVTFGNVFPFFVLLFAMSLSRRRL